MDKLFVNKPVEINYNAVENSDYDNLNSFVVKRFIIIFLLSSTNNTI